MATPGVIPTDANRDTVVRLERQTRGGRRLFYQLTVLQQPERARACGAGTKANSDRRPVDPPPVVELRIKEGNSFEDSKEITFDYNASFFLYASLEQYRKIAPGRMQSQPNPPILTGVPASGMAYLDRPAAAGYFIFPDLSVRHEGQYRLSFSLFETTKEEKDFDLTPANADLPSGVDWRMEIKTAPFDVYSAKKFPGLMESTALSKEVAEQGCRVRIRRDVRMRKRDGKNGGRDRREEDFARRRTVTPATEDPHARARSLSNSSEHRVPYHGEPMRRPSIGDGYAHPPPPPPPSQQAFDNGNRGHLSFGDQGAPRYAVPHQYPPPQRLPPISPGPLYAGTPKYMTPDPQTPSYSMGRRALPPCPSPVPRHEGHHRRYSGESCASTTSTNYAAEHGRRDPSQSYPTTPLTSYTPRKQEAPSAPTVERKGVLKISQMLSPEVIEVDDSEPTRAPTPMQAGDKRKRDDVFPQSNQSLHNGQRQLDRHFSGTARSRYLPEDYDSLCFPRANGKISLANVPDCR